MLTRTRKKTTANITSWSIENFPHTCITYNCIYVHTYVYVHNATKKHWGGMLSTKEMSTLMYVGSIEIIDFYGMWPSTVTFLGKARKDYLCQQMLDNCCTYVFTYLHTNSLDNICFYVRSPNF
jgi:hypothetical protein